MFQNADAIISHIYTSGLVIRAGLDSGFALRGHSYLLTNHAELSKSQHICSPFTPAICPSHTLQLCCVCVWCVGMRISQGRVTKREERDERKAKRWEEKRAIMQMWLNDVAVPRATVISSALSFIYYHTTAGTVYILIDCKSQHTFTLIMAMTFNIGHPCQARCFADIQKLSLMDWVSHHKGN